MDSQTRLKTFLDAMVGTGGYKRHSMTHFEAVLGVGNVPTRENTFRREQNLGGPRPYQGVKVSRLIGLHDYLSELLNDIEQSMEDIENGEIG